MKNDRILEILHQVSISVLERLAFIFSAPALSRNPFYQQSLNASYVKFTGPFSGILVFAITDKALAEITENMLGIESPDKVSLEQRQDALKEIVNVICGNILPELAGKQIVFNVSMPLMVSACPISQLNPQDSGQYIAKLDLERGQCDVVLILNDCSTGTIIS